MDDRKDYDELLKRLEKPAHRASTSKTSSNISNTDPRSSDHRQRDETNTGILDKPDVRVIVSSHTGSSLLFADGTARAKNKRRLYSSLGDLLLVLDLRRSEKMQELVIAPEGLTVVSAENMLGVYLTVTSKDQETKKWTCEVKIRRK